jgi:hypothetical protein
MYRRDGESHKYVDKDNICMSVSDMEINTEIDLRVYTGHTLCKPANTVLCFFNGCEVYLRIISLKELLDRLLHYKMCEDIGLFENSTTQECCLRIYHHRGCYWKIPSH